MSVSGGGIIYLFPSDTQTHRHRQTFIIILTRELVGRRVEGYQIKRFFQSFLHLLFHIHTHTEQKKKNRERYTLREKKKDKEFSRDPFGKRRLAVDRGIVVISQKPIDYSAPME